MKRLPVKCFMHRFWRGCVEKFVGAWSDRPGLTNCLNLDTEDYQTFSATLFSKPWVTTSKKGCGYAPILKKVQIFFIVLSIFRGSEPIPTRPEPIRIRSGYIRTIVL